MPREPLPTLAHHRATLATLAGRWRFFRAYYGLRLLPSEPPSKHQIAARARRAARADARDGRRIL